MMYIIAKLHALKFPLFEFIDASGSAWDLHEVMKFLKFLLEVDSERHTSAAWHAEVFACEPEDRGTLAAMPFGEEPDWAPAID